MRSWTLGPEAWRKPWVLMLLSGRHACVHCCRLLLRALILKLCFLEFDEKVRYCYDFVFSSQSCLKHCFRSRPSGVPVSGSDHYTNSRISLQQPLFPINSVCGLSDTKCWEISCLLWREHTSRHYRQQDSHITHFAAIFCIVANNIWRGLPAG